MATVRLNIQTTEPSNVHEPLWDDLPLMEKFRRAYTDPSEARKINHRSKRVLYAIVAFLVVTEPYVFIKYIVPRLYADYDDWSQYWLKVLFVFLTLQVAINYLCTVLYSTSIKKTRDNPSLETSNNNDQAPDYFQYRIVDMSSANGHASPITDHGGQHDGMTWKYCELCDIHIPPRAHHCRLCNACILKHDHHCYFVGTCVGFRNQRYFFVLTFYGFITELFALCCNYQYLKLLYLPHAYSWTDLLLPVTFYRWIIGTWEPLEFHIFLMVMHVYFAFLYTLLCLIYFTSQVVFSYLGVTFHEFRKEVKVQSKNSMNANLRSIFGDFWALNFLFPMIILFKQHGDGCSWEGVKIVGKRSAKSN